MLLKLKAKLEDLKESYERLSSRDRRALGVLVGVASALIVVGLVLTAVTSVQGIEEEIETTRDALRDIERYRRPFLENKWRQAALEQRVPVNPLELNAYVEKVASGVGIKIDESNETKPVVGSPYSRRGLEIKLRKVTLDKLGHFLERLVSSTQSIVQVTELSVSARWGQHEELDVELTISTYDRSKKRSRKGKASKGEG